MKYKLLFTIVVLITTYTFSQVGIGTTTPNNSSSLDVVSTTRGVLIPRMTVAQRIAIVNPAEGLLVYQINDVKGFYFYNGTSWNRLLDKSKDGNPIGTIISFYTNNVPSGYLECNGAAVSRTTYADLFSIIGASYGAGNGTTTFNLPDYRGQFLRGYNHGSGVDPDVASRTNRGDGTTGDAVGTKQNNQILVHHHVVNPPATNTNTTGNHRHTIDPPNTYTAFGGNHRHSTNLYRVGGYNTPSRPARNTYKRYSKWHPNTLQYTDYSGYHRHTVKIAPFNSFLSGNHNHTLDIPAFNSTNSGGSETRPKNITVMYCKKY